MYWRTGVSGAELTTSGFLDSSRVCDLERRWIEGELCKEATKPTTVHAEAGSRGEVYALRVAGMESLAPR